MGTGAEASRVRHAVLQGAHGETDVRQGPEPGAVADPSLSGLLAFPGAGLGREGEPESLVSGKGC